MGKEKDYIWKICMKKDIRCLPYYYMLHTKEINVILYKEIFLLPPMVNNGRLFSSIKSSFQCLYKFGLVIIEEETMNIVCII